VKRCLDQVALVTGASRGIGVAIAERLAAEGAAVAVAARSLDSHPHLPGTLLETVRRIRESGGRAEAIQVDLLRAEGRQRVVAETESKLGPIDILVNNAAAAFYMPFDAVSARRYEVAFEVNVRAPFDLCQRVLPAMRARRRGWIVNVSSATAELPQGPPYDEWHRRGGDVLYGATKAALNRFTVGLAAELYGEGIAVNTLAPVAAVMTPGVEALGVVPDESFTEPVEWIAEAALALCTCDPNALTGRVTYSRPLLEELGLIKKR